jgi:hypothetical protein
LENQLEKVIVADISDKHSLVSVQNIAYFFTPSAPDGSLSPTPQQHTPVLTGLTRIHAATAKDNRQALDTIDDPLSFQQKDLVLPLKTPGI